MTYPQLFTTRPIIIVEDDKDDQFIFDKLLTELGVSDHARYFSRSTEAFDYLLHTVENPSLILCDINLPVMNGIEFKAKIDQDPILRQKSIPFVFLSTAASKHIVKQAYEQLTIQGFFQKSDSYLELKDTLYLILAYWQRGQNPNKT